MSHASEDDLLDLALRAAEPDARPDPHVEACPECGARYRAVLAEQSLLRRAFAGGNAPARLAPAPKRRSLLPVAAALLFGAALGSLFMTVPKREVDPLSLERVEDELRRIPAEVGSLRAAELARLEREVPQILSRAEALYGERLERLLDMASPLNDAQRSELRSAVDAIYDRVWTEEDGGKLAREFRETLRTALNEAQYRALEDRLARDREVEWEQELEIVLDELSEALNLRFSEAEEVRRTLREHFPKTDLPLLSMAQWPPDRLAGDRKLSGAVRKVLPAGYHAEFGRYVDALQSGRKRFEQAARRPGR
jgi:hypothetical protein